MFPFGVNTNLQLLSHLNNLATFYKARSNYEGAEARLKEVLAIQKSHLKADDPQLVATLNSLVGVLRYEKKDAEADVLAKEIQGIQGGAKLLQKGMYGPEVRKLQSQLKKLGFYQGDLDQVFGPATEAAVIGFQKNQGLLADGIAGERTLALLDQPQVNSITTLEIQKELQKLGFYSGAPDGSFGLATKAALIDFQRSKGLVADGTANAITLEALGFKTSAKARSITGKVYGRNRG